MINQQCEECARPRQGKFRRGRCEGCYRRHISKLKREGNFRPVEVPDLRGHKARLFSRVTPGWGGCWIYTGKTDRYGYGIVRERNSEKKAHRSAYERTIGPIPVGLQLDHLCHSASTGCRGGVTCHHRRCINPAHLEPVSGLENVRRGESPTSINARKTHCIRGHAFTPENTMVCRSRSGTGRPERKCRACIRIRRAAARAALTKIAGAA